jgi:hypothetical protein
MGNFFEFSPGIHLLSKGVIARFTPDFRIFPLHDLAAPTEPRLGKQFTESRHAVAISLGYGK